jgi:hypothetical protein
VRFAQGGRHDVWVAIWSRAHWAMRSMRSCAERA